MTGTPAIGFNCNGFFDVFCKITGKSDLSSSAPPVGAPTAAASPGAALPGGAARLRASRIFSGPGQYPPAEFAAYGVVAFPSLAASDDRARHLMICEAYVAVLPNASRLATPRAEQMVTVWPVDADALGDRLTLNDAGQPCEDAVRHYDQTAGLAAMQAAEQTGDALGDGRGPYLLAWSPGSGHGAPDAHVLRVDMSNVRTGEQARGVFRRWAREIEERPELWRRGWNLQDLRLVLRNWADDMGARIMPE